MVDYKKCLLLQYKSGKLKKVKDLLGLPGLSGDLSEYYLYSTMSVNSIKVKKNSIIVRNTTGFLTFGYSNIDVTYSYKKGKMNKSTSGSLVNIMNVNGKYVKSLKAKKTFQVYKDTKFKKKYFKIKSKQNVSFIKIGGTFKKYWVKVKVGKKTGYIKAINRDNYYNDNGYASGDDTLYFYKMIYPEV